MSLEPREPAAAESYSTFWVEKDAVPVPNTVTVPAEAAYEAFVSLCEDYLPEDANPDAE